MTKRLQAMRELATKEAKKLKTQLTEEEKLNLNESSFDPEDEEQCIYGQITGDCRSERAYELIMGCCERVYSGNTLDLARRTLNGKPTECEASERLWSYNSPIETLIFPINGGKTDGIKIIKYLKGETKTLKL